ncbi:MAG: bifunctional biotin--[acetyl-CoA-carboxylase] ligase/biotin operon repressor BirA [Pantoea sp. Brub]|nr:bifunctional biotin--[acetyl-CoA-carboxylase] ligase/biotin operon repressor BirA [Pantoea sp. Brub]
MKDYTMQLKLINILSDGKIYSNNNLTKILGIDSISINNHIESLKNWGLNISIFGNTNYSIGHSIELLDEKAIQLQFKKNTVSVFSIIDSTNQYLLRNINNLKSGDICISEYQESGRGKQESKWFSPFGNNIYMSIHWQMNNMRFSVIGLSLAIGIVISEKLQSIGVKDVLIKWPNDIYVYDKKLAGILIELKMNKITNNLNIIIGIGININMKSVNFTDINPQWINLQELGYKIDRNEFLIGLVINIKKYLAIFERYGFLYFLSKWFKFDYLINKYVKLVVSNNKEIYGIVRGIDQTGSLLLEQNGKISSWVEGKVFLLSLQQSYKKHFLYRN